MPASALGKRSRSLAGTAAVETPCKKSRRRGPALPSSCSSDNDENREPGPTAESDDEADDQSSPSRSRILADPVAGHDKTPSAWPSASRSRSSTLGKPLTPSTPRHHDAFAHLPATPRHVVMSAGKLFSRLTPQSPLSPSSLQTVYQSARQLFARGLEPRRLVGRDTERARLTDFLSRSSSSSPHGFLYVSGAPGTGKSALMTELSREFSNGKNIRSVYLNCMTIKSPKDLYTALLTGLGLEDDPAALDAATTLRRAFCSTPESATVYLVTLDEMDHLLTMGLESLYRVLEWSLDNSSRLLLVGIANALDLTDRFLPRLRSMHLKPELLSFVPYTTAQVRNIIVTRLQSLAPADKPDLVPLIHPAAIDLCARKVSGQTGDLRKAFEICRRALDLVEAETRWKHEEEAREKALQMTPSKRPLGEKVNGATGPDSASPRSLSQMATASMKALTAESAPRASIAHVNKVTAAAFGNGTTQRLKTLNLQQRAALCALVAYERRARRTMMQTAKKQPSTPSKGQQARQSPTVRKLFEAYSQLCTRDSLLHPLSSSEFREVVGSLETLGLVDAVDGKGQGGSLTTTLTPSRRGRRGGATAGATAGAGNGDQRRIASCVGERELEAVTDGLGGGGILREILAGEGMED